jgi:hypothetical protein
MIRLALAGRTLRFLRGGEVLSPAVPLGPALLRATCLRHDPPTGPELEAAVEAVEEAVMPLHGRWQADPQLEVAVEAPWPAALPAALDRQSLEDLFDRAAAVAQGRPASSDPALADPELVAWLVLLREVMHHLGFERLQRAPG